MEYRKLSRDETKRVVSTVNVDDEGGKYSQTRGKEAKEGVSVVSVDGAGRKHQLETRRKRGMTTANDDEARRKCALPSNEEAKWGVN